MRVIKFFIFIATITFFIYFLEKKKKSKKEKKKKISIFREYIKNIKVEIDPHFNQIKKYYINLKDSKERLKNIQNQIKNLKLNNIERIEAIGTKFLENIKEVKNKKSRPIACFLSHIKAIKTAYESKENYAIIMEDDINLNILKVWKHSFDKILNSLPEDLEILNLCSQKYNKNVDYIDYIDSKKYLESGAVCYLISRKGIEKIVNLLIKKDGSYNLVKNYKYVSDKFLYDYLNSYILIPKLFLLNDSNLESTIHNNGNHNNDLDKFLRINSNIIDKYYNHVI